MIFGAPETNFLDLLVIFFGFASDFWDLLVIFGAPRSNFLDLLVIFWDLLVISGIC